jgi:hypothetical protein
MKWSDVVALAQEFPGVVEGSSYGTPALKVRGKMLTRLRDEDASVVLPDVPPEERAMLVESTPAVFHFTPHYQDYPIVLARLSRISRRQLHHFLYRRWRNIAGKRLLEAHAEQVRSSSKRQ